MGRHRLDEHDDQQWSAATLTKGREEAGVPEPGENQAAGQD
ncbi:hypothetical protein [Crossiella cryophila]|uniref:Uncharacterized protein n=1 Tax=Crossiella cryophila TaxID=43355 RepID=A0A7W7CG25_9PSEU|nr:hypothetical protein [Crossiella cryophila]MBB4680577.1 hypothetical protein [Crossiella cryophila]